MKSCKTYEFLIGRPLQREIHTRWGVYFLCVCMCVRVCWTVADGLLTHSHYTGIMLLLALSGWLRFLYLTHAHYILLSTTHGVFDYDSVIKKSLSFTNLENDYPLRQSSVLFTYKLDSANNIMDYIIWKNSFHLL